MDAGYQSVIIGWMRKSGVEFARGLSDDEMQEVEKEFGLKFPPDLRGFLQAAMPVSDPFPDWRGSRQSLKERLEWPLDGMCFDIKHNNYWRPAWGERPASLRAAFARARAEVAKAPRLIPVYAHRYLVSEPCQSGNPVLSVYQTDTIVYGYDLASYFREELGIPTPPPSVPMPRPIPFWGYDIGGIWNPDNVPQPPSKAHLPEWKGYIGSAFVREVLADTNTDVVAHLQILAGPPSLWLWCQVGSLPAATGELLHNWFLRLDGYMWERSDAAGHKIAQPGQRSPYTELTGRVVTIESGELQLDCNGTVIRVVLEGELPAEGDWISVAGILNGKRDPDD